MTDEHSESIFDFASKKPARPLKKKHEASAPPPSPKPRNPETPIREAPPVVAPADTQPMDELIEAVKQKREALNRQLDETYRRIGQTRDSVSEYLNNPSNFPETTWKIVQQQREEFTHKVTILGTKSTTKELRQAKKAHEEKKRKGKSLGARRNWLSM